MYLSVAIFEIYERAGDMRPVQVVLALSMLLLGR